MRPLASPAALDAATPGDRDRYLDLLRALALAVVVFGHWLTAVVWVDGDGLHASTLLERLPASRWATWVVQIMPVFFLVGGVVNARSWRSVLARGGDWPTWVRARATRLLRPVLPLLWVWAVLCAGLAAAGLDPALVRQGSLAALVALWFIAVYLLVIAATPAALAMHARAGRWSPAVPVALGVAAAGVDVAHLAGVGVVGFANFFLVWAAVHQLGICWGDGFLQGPRAQGSKAPWVLLGGGLGVLIVLVGWGGYPASMVGVDGLRSNTFPPSVALVALGFAQAGVVLAVADGARRRLASPRLWRGVIAVNLVAMTVYLWHS
ncbi:MAG: acyltransferase family protein, partial [Nitriliruptorales bacterium]|nr:acyltransferase family protein [Nitriliruptorales bacterium]